MSESSKAVGFTPGKEESKYKVSGTNHLCAGNYVICHASAVQPAISVLHDIWREGLVGNVSRATLDRVWDVIMKAEGRI